MDYLNQHTSPEMAFILGYIQGSTKGAQHISRADLWKRIIGFSEETEQAYLNGHFDAVEKDDTRYKMISKLF